MTLTFSIIFLYTPAKTNQFMIINMFSSWSPVGFVFNS